jgi:hypothetical protein
MARAVGASGNRSGRLVSDKGGLFLIPERLPNLDEGFRAVRRGQIRLTRSFGSVVAAFKRSASSSWCRPDVLSDGSDGI